jgi:hypothetical protein
VERKRAREAEEWRLKQLRSGVSSQQNSNFQVSQLLHVERGNAPSLAFPFAQWAGLNDISNYCALAMICRVIEKVEYNECGK